MSGNHPSTNLPVVLAWTRSLPRVKSIPVAWRSPKAFPGLSWALTIREAEEILQLQNLQPLRTRG
jgi:hypothetical protein